MHRSYYYYEQKRDDSEVEDAIRSASEFEEGFWKIYKRLRKEGYPWNHKKVYRVYKNIHYNKRARLKKCLPARVKNPLVTPILPNDIWSLDFISDRLESGRQFRVLNVLDDFNREAVAQEISMSMPTQRVIKLLEKVIWLKGKPSAIRTDNGPEFISKEMDSWCKANDIQHIFTQPGKPTQNSYIERFNGSYRRAVLDAYIFRSLSEARELTDCWMEDYNERRPHEALGDMSPIEYKNNFYKNEQLENSN